MGMTWSIDSESNLGHARAIAYMVIALVGGANKNVVVLCKCVCGEMFAGGNVFMVSSHLPRWPGRFLPFVE